MASSHMLQGNTSETKLQMGGKSVANWAHLMTTIKARENINSRKEMVSFPMISYMTLSSKTVVYSYELKL